MTATAGRRGLRMDAADESDVHLAARVSRQMLHDLLDLGVSVVNSNREAVLAAMMTDPEGQRKRLVEQGRRSLRETGLPDDRPPEEVTASPPNQNLALERSDGVQSHGSPVQRTAPDHGGRRPASPFPRRSGRRVYRA